jgi:beta-galactosidase
MRQPCAVELGRKALHTAGDEDARKVEAEQREIRAKGKDLTHISSAVGDRSGNTKDLGEDKVTVKVEGAGTRAALGSSAGSTEEYNYQRTHGAFGGTALAIVSAGCRAGRMIMKIFPKGLESQEVETATSNAGSVT